MADQQNISSILAALSSASGGTPTPNSQQTVPGSNYPQSYQNAAPPMGSTSYPLPQPVSSGSVDLSAIKPVSSGSVSIADAIAKARGFAAERGVFRNDDNRQRSGRSRSPSRSPTRGVKNTFRDNYNPYRDERRGGHDRGFARERSFSPPRPIEGYSLSNNRPYGTPDMNRGSMERGPAENEVERIPIEKSFVGLIIGRSGDTLRRVEQTTGARVQFRDGPESGGSIRNCDISGSKAARASAKAEILRIIDEHGQGNKGGPDRSRPQVRAESLTQDEIENGTQIMVPDRTVGLIIGRGGETIRDLQERSGCHVNIVGENKSVSGLRPVNLIGSEQSQQMAKDLIMDIVESDSRNNASKQDSSRSMARDDPYGGGADKITDKIMVPGDAVGMIIGKGGESIKEMQSSSGCKINVTQPTGRDIEREIGLVGTRQAIEVAKRAIMEKVDAVHEHRGRNQGRDSRHEDPYRSGDQSYAPQQHQQQPYSSGSAGPQHPGAAAAGGADPYAAYGGYDNYVAMWYAAMAQQQQQGVGEQPPGA